MKLIKPVVKIIINFKNVRIAELITNPNQVAIAILFKKDIDFLSNFQFELFSTKEAALIWLGVN